MQLKNTLMVAALFLAAFTSCKDDKDDEATPTPEEEMQTLSGEVSGTWTSGKTYMVSGDLVVPAGKSLTIEEGVTVVMDTTAKPEFIVLGNLYCTGTAASPIMITVPEGARTEKNKFGALWGGILAAPTCNELVLDNVILEYGGATTTEASASVKQGLYKAESGERLPALWFSNVNGKFVVQNSIVRNFQEDAFYIEGGQSIVANNKFYTTGLTNGEAINYKSGTQADVAFNLIYSPNTNGLKLSNSGDRTPQAYIIAYNNTIVNAGWRRPDIKGGSIWIEKSVHTDLYNNLIANSRFGIKRDTKNPEDSRSTISNTFYYGYTQEGVDQFQSSTEIVAGANDVTTTTAGGNDPKFVSYPLSTAGNNATFSTSWDFHLSADSPALNKGTTDFTRHFANGLVIHGVTYTSPAPATYIGAMGTK
ncbi:right-handed parallel beta-helix repeat-containing protein [Pontibacter silvestris]|uniref:Right-handed parallel beta-helix repeat-containing protein n=2 Tax=Pontibacter silvestris TaxID=2305183 RepID=A0ABW4WW95_9BACT|nr:right-handed parallel beta-helix repeat-containing protein [Pontibacter silvestris]